MSGATHGSTADQPCVFGVVKLIWTEAAKVKGGVPWHLGLLQEAERFPLGTRTRRRPADNEPESSLDTTPTNGTGVGRVETAREESKREEADRVARYDADWISYDADWISVPDF